MPSEPESGPIAEDAATPDETAVLALLDEVEPVHIDGLADRSPFGIARLQAALFGLLVRGDVEELAGNRYLLARKAARRISARAPEDP